VGKRVNEPTRGALASFAIDERQTVEQVHC